MNPQRLASIDVANDLQKTGWIMEVLTLIELVNACFEMYKNCWNSPKTAKRYLQANYFNDEFSPTVFRPACRQVRRAARQRGENLTEDQIQQIAKATLLKAMNSSDEVVTACFIPDV